MYKAVVILYIVCFGSYLLFTRVPDYFEGEFVTGTVGSATFSTTSNSPQLIINYPVGSEVLQYKTDMWFLNKYTTGEKVTVIYNPTTPQVASIYALIGYWIRWSELLFTLGFFIVLFIAAKTITGPQTLAPLTAEELRKKRKYKD